MTTDNDDGVSCIIFFVGFLLGIFIAGMLSWKSFSDMKIKAIQEDAAEYVTDKATGLPEFRWIDPRRNKK